MLIQAKRISENPIISPIRDSLWEAEATFNPTVVKHGDMFHLLYRAQSLPHSFANTKISLSTIGYTHSGDGIHFRDRRQFINPQFSWEKFGCEDPRITFIDNKFFIFYTALGGYPYNASNIKVALATTNDFSQVTDKHLVTPFNAKAFVLFPEKIGGKFTALLTVHTDSPPAKISIAYFDEEEDIWSQDFWNQWYKHLDYHTLSLQRTKNDHVEVGAPPVKTTKGWLVVYSYIYNYFSPPATFAIEAVLLDLQDPMKILTRTRTPLLTADAYYEIYGKVPNIVFPSGAVVDDMETLFIYYGAADTTCCVAEVSLPDLLEDLVPQSYTFSLSDKSSTLDLLRYPTENPILEPIEKNQWESKYVFNPGALLSHDCVHLLYRAMGSDDTSVLGYALSMDGVKIDVRLERPVFTPREDFEKKARPGWSGCEDPRLTEIEGKIYMCYTAFNAVDYPRVAMTSISYDDFARKNWIWDKSILISPPGMDDKDACLFEEKIRGKYVFLHRFPPNIWIDFVDDLTFSNNKFLKGKILMSPRVHSWDSEKIGIGPPPVKTRDGWLLIYHGLSRYSLKYRLGAVLLDLENPAKVIAQLDYPILEPETEHEKKGFRPNTVFSCGAVVLKNRLFIYYGAGDQVIGVVSFSLDNLLKELSRYKIT